MRLIRKIEMALDRFKGKCLRFRRGYSYGDVWDFNTWFIETAEPMLRHLAEHGKGYPYGMKPDEWSKTLIEMADCLHNMNEDNVVEKIFGGFENVNSPDDLTLIRDELYRNRDRFMELFSKHFFDLWD